MTEYITLPLRMYQNEDEIDAPDESSLDCGDEWPDCEHPDVARYRRFYQVGGGGVYGVGLCVVLKVHTTPYDTAVF